MTDVLTEMSSPGKQLSFLLACLLAPAILGVSLNYCGGSSNDKTAEVVRGENSSFTCTLDSAESTHTLEWRVNTQPGYTAGTCPPPPTSNSDTCTNTFLHPSFIPRRTETTRSVMTVDPTKANQLAFLESGILICKDTNNQQDSCTMDYITPASGTCSSLVNTDTYPLTVTSDCNITQGNSSRGRYKCQIYYKKEGNTEEKAVGSLSEMTDNTLPTGSARCLTTHPLSNQNGRYTYSVMILPGRQFFPAGTVDISRPTPPTIMCTPADRVTENTPLRCTCTTQNVGKPPGLLRWFKDNIDVITTGASGISKLEFVQTLNRSDDGVKFSCHLIWSQEPLLSTEYIASVGYPASMSELTIDQSSTSDPVTVSENTTVTFDCRATGGNPSSNMTLSHSTSILEFGPSPLTFDLPDVRCEHSGVYRCKGHNGFGHAVITTSSLIVLCSPRGPSKITALNFIDNQVGTSFSVTAYPVPALAFSYLGRSENTTGSPKPISDSITLDGSCEARRGIVHQSTCTITVYNVTSDEAAGIYQVNVSNTQGETNAMFEVKYRAPLPTSEEPSSGNAAVIGGVVGAVVVAGIIAVVVVIVLKRRKGPDKKHSRSTPAGRPRNGQGRNNYHDMEESGPADADPEAQSRPLSFAPMAVYAQVDRNNKNRKAAAALEANDGQPADEYAQVDKPKKSKQGAADQDAETNGGQPADVYADVDKTKKKQASGAGAKPKTGAKAAGKPKKEKKKKDKRDESAHVYGNVEEIKQGKGAKAKKSTTPPKEETSSGKVVTPEGLIYTAVEFSQPPKAGKPATKKPEEAVVYSAVDFKKSPPAP